MPNSPLQHSIGDISVSNIEIIEIDQSAPVKKTEWKTIFRQGLWDNNSTLVQLLGLCPLLAVSNSVTHALGLGLATMLVLICTNAIVSVCRSATPHEIRIPIYVMIIAATVTAVQLLMNAFVYELYLALGIFIPLIVTNCIVIGRAEAFASKNAVLPSIFDGFSMGLGMTCSLFVLGAMREILGNGTLFNGLDQLFGSWAKSLRLEILHVDTSFLLAILPPGAFIGLGLMLALKNLIDKKKR